MRRIQGLRRNQETLKNSSDKNGKSLKSWDYHLRISEILRNTNLKDFSTSFFLMHEVGALYDKSVYEMEIFSAVPYLSLLFASSKWY